MKYRIINYGSSYEVQYRRRWWPFWSIYYWPACGGMLCTKTTLAGARGKLDTLKADGPHRPGSQHTVVHEE